MKNSEILVKSLTEWLNPIISDISQVVFQKNITLSLVQEFISPEWMSKSIIEHLGVPELNKVISKLPEDSIPAFSLNMIDGVIDKRVKEGALRKVIFGEEFTLEPNLFKDLKRICESNFAQYSEQTATAEQGTKNKEQRQGSKNKTDAANGNKEQEE